MESLEMLKAPSNSRKGQVAWWISGPIILTVIGSAFLADMSFAAKATKTPPTIWSDEDCLKCHVDRDVLKKMQDKKGDSNYCVAAFKKLSKEQNTYDSNWTPPSKLK